jgi:hypothetical protein
VVFVVDEELSIILLPKQDNVYYIDPYFRKDIAKTKSIGKQVELIFMQNQLTDKEKSIFKNAFYRKLRMLKETWKNCFELDGFGRMKHAEGLLYEMRITVRDLNIRILFVFAIKQSREIAVLLQAFHEKNSNNYSRDSHKTADKVAFDRAQQLKASRIIDEIVQL